MIFQRLSQAFFSVLLFASSLGKLFDMLGFYGIVQSYQLIPAVLVPFAAWSLAITELSICILLATRNMSTQNQIARSWVKHTIQLLIALHLFFLFGLSSAFARGLALPNCGCFGVYWPRPLTHWSIVEDLVLTAWTVIFYLGFNAQTRRIMDEK